MSTNAEAKSAIFDSIRRSLEESRPFDAVHREHEAHRQPVSDDSPAALMMAAADSLTDVFRENLISIGGNCLIVSDLNQAAGAVRELIAEKKPNKIAVSQAAAHLLEPVANDFETLVDASKGELFECDLGITWAQSGIAETGTLVIESDKEYNRLTSLVPPVHICLLEAKNIRRTLGETLEILKPT